MGYHVPQEKKPTNFLVYLSNFYCVLFLQMVFKNSRILRRKIVVVLWFHNSEIIGACYLRDMVGDLIQLIMLLFWTYAYILFCALCLFQSAHLLTFLFKRQAITFVSVAYVLYSSILSCKLSVFLLCNNIFQPFPFFVQLQYNYYVDADFWYDSSLF